MCVCVCVCVYYAALFSLCCHRIGQSRERMMGRYITTTQKQMKVHGTCRKARCANDNHHARVRGGRQRRGR